jgi:hypothetical protein
MKCGSCLGMEAKFYQAMAALTRVGSLSFFSGRMPRNKKNGATSNSNQFELLVIEEDGMDDNTGGGTSAASATYAMSTRGNARSHMTQSHRHGRSLFPRRLKRQEVPQKPMRTHCYESKPS